MEVHPKELANHVLLDLARGGKHSAHGGSPCLLTALGGTRSMYAGKMLEFVREDYSHFQCSVL